VITQKFDINFSVSRHRIKMQTMARKQKLNMERNVSFLIFDDDCV